MFLMFLTCELGDPVFQAISGVYSGQRKLKFRYDLLHQS